MPTISTPPLPPVLPGRVTPVTKPLASRQESLEFLHLDALLKPEQNRAENKRNFIKLQIKASSSSGEDEVQEFAVLKNALKKLTERVEICQSVLNVYLWKRETKLIPLDLLWHPLSSIVFACLQ